MFTIPVVGTWPDRRHCGTLSGQQQLRQVPQLAKTRRLWSPACLPVSYQCSGLMPRGQVSQTQGMRLKVVGMSSAIWDRKIATPVGAANVGSGWVAGTGGAILLVARDGHVHQCEQMQQRCGHEIVCVRTLIRWYPREVGATSHAARTMDHGVGQSSDQKRSKQICRKWEQLAEGRANCWLSRQVRKLGRRGRGACMMKWRVAC